MTLIFFFQAEDGIRDVAVTGVQTCALPIYLGHVWPVLVAGSAPGRATLFPQDVLASVQRDTTHPGGEPRLPSKVSEGEVGLDESLLRDVLCLRGISEHAEHEIVHQHLVALDQDAVRSSVPGQASGDDGPFVDGIGLAPGID